MTSSLLNIGMSGLNSAQLSIATTGNNISNTATPGYSRELAVMAEANGINGGSGFVGGGVNTVTIQRQFSLTLNSELNSAQSQSASLTSYSTLIAQLNNLVGSPTQGISSAMSGFFGSLQDVISSNNLTAALQTALSSGQTLGSLLNAAGQQFDQLRQGINTTLSSTVTQVNTLSNQIAQLNTQIAAASSAGQPPNQLLDARDAAVSQLGQLIGVSVVPTSGSYTVVLANGQPLVSGGQSYQLTTVQSPDDPSEQMIGYQQPDSANPGKTITTLLPDSAVTGGSLGGTLSFRSQTLDPAESQLGAIATSFAAQVNAQNALGLDENGNPGGNLFQVAPPNVIANLKNTGGASLSATLTNPSSPPGGDLKLKFDGTTYTLTDASTGKVLGTSTTPPSAANPIGGVAMTIAGTMAAGDSFTIQTTRGALNSFDVVATDGSQIAAAAPAIVSATNSNTGTGKIQVGTASPGFSITSPMTLTYDSTAGGLTGFPPGTSVTINTTPPQTITINAATDVVPYDPATGNTFTINSTATPPTAPNGIAFSLSGTPKTGDTFTVGPNSASTKDGTNATAIANLVSSTALSGSTLTNSYASYVNNVGNTASQVTAANNAQTTLVSQITALQQSVSGVNLDEEATNLVMYQQLYQANSKVIQAAQSLFTTILQAIN